jgi:alpha-ketoglutarate-dependent taurine dioxygenase
MMAFPDLLEKPSLEESAPVEPPPMAPLTIWGDKISDIRQAQAEARSKEAVEFTRTVNKEDVLPAGADKDAELAWMSENAKDLKDSMEKNGAVVFRGFDLMKEQKGFEEFYEAIGMKTCLDPLFSVSARPTADGNKNSAVYEAVNKESRKNFFIGMHNEFVGTRAPRAAAFVSFKAAETGGEFIVGDGRAVFRDLDPDVLERLHQRKIRYGVMELPFFGWVDKLPENLQAPTMSTFRALASAAINVKVDFNVELLEQRGGYDNTRILQARAPSQAPVVRHPVTREPTWFCNVHSHSSKLRKAREDEYGAEKFEDGASQINKSDFFYGDDGDLSDADLKHLDEVTRKNMKYIKMKEGDVVLLDNYKTMHGRNVFDGTRKHAVAWFGGWEGEDEQRSRQWNL